MEPHLLGIFQLQVAAQCRFLLRAAHEINAALTNGDVEGVFYGLQNFLSSGANISKALWGPGGRFAEQRKPLRDSICIADDSPLRQVTMRNNFEHFDERIDKWWEESTRHNFLDTHIGVVEGFEDIDRFRQFDPRSGELSFWGQRFNLQELVNEVQSILPRLEAEIFGPRRRPAGGS
jgi:hypothetical protein